MPLGLFCCAVMCFSARALSCLSLACATEAGKRNASVLEAQRHSWDLQHYASPRALAAACAIMQGRTESTSSLAFARLLYFYLSSAPIIASAQRLKIPVFILGGYGLAYHVGRA